MNKSYKLILASNSPRRRSILKEAGYTFEVRLKSVAEDYPQELAPELVGEFLAKKKAQAYQNELQQDEILITADTTVLIDNVLLEKPTDRKEAYLMLRRLSGRTHKVITGVCMCSLKKMISFSDMTEVTFREMTDEEIYNYIDTYNPYDKAGSYGAQEGIGLTCITMLKGSYFNVMGLPIHLIDMELKKF
ncbi:MAG: Maf-like protein [Flammeovirgaceae bacterium]